MPTIELIKADAFDAKLAEIDAVTADRVEQTGADRAAAGVSAGNAAASAAAAETAKEDAEDAASAAVAAQAIAEAAAANAQTSALTCATWAALAALTGTTAGQGAEVLDTDSGTHTDPVVGGTVNNAGRYTWSASPAGWQRIGDTGLAGKAPTVHSHSIGQVDGLAAELDALGLFPGRGAWIASETASLPRILNLRLYGADPTKFYFVKFLFWLDAGTRFNLTIQRADDADGTGAVDVAVLSVPSGADGWTGIREVLLVPSGGSGITGRAFVNFSGITSMAVNLAPSSAAMFNRRLLNRSALFLDAPQVTAEVNAGVTAALAAAAAAPGSKRPFADAMTTDLLRRLVRRIDIFNAPDRAQRYVISQFNVEQFPATPLTRVMVDLRDTVLGAVVARYIFSVAAAPAFADFMATVPSVLRLDDFSLSPAPNGTRIVAMVEIDKTQIATWMAHAATTVAGGGVHPDQQHPDEMQADYLDDDRAHEVLRVGTGQPFTTLRGAVESTYGEGTTVSGYRRGRAHYHRRQRVEIVDDAEFQATYLDAPEFVEIVGQGRGRTRIVKENSNNNPLFELPLSGKVADLTIYSDTGDGGSNLGQYCVHWDDFNRRSRGGKTQNLRIRQSMRNVDLIGGPGQRTWLLGSGISSGGEMLLENVHAWHEADLTGASGAPAAFGIHNSGPTKSAPTIAYSDKPARVRMRGCSSTDQTTVACYVQTIAASARCTLDLLGCDFWMVRQDVAIPLDAPDAAQPDLARDRFAWEITGKHDGAILQTDPLGLIVLATTAGATVSGDAALLIFGTVDNLGRGEKWVKDGSTTRSLGKRLGDCSSVNKTLTIGGQSHVFSTDLTAASNATIIAAINGSITANPVSEVDIQHEVYPDVGTKRRVKNSTGATIPKGRAVKLTGLNTVALCGAGERPDGWTFRAIPDGAMGQIITGKRVAVQYIDGAAASTGEWGITASGQIDYAASVKLGRTIGGVVTVW